MRGWSQRRAAIALGVTYQHLNMVLRGHRQSRRILAGIHALPPRRPSARQLAAAGSLAAIHHGRKGGRA